MKVILWIFFILYSLYATAQDKDFTFYPAILPGVYTTSEINMKDHNPLITGKMPVTKANF